MPGFLPRSFVALHLVSSSFFLSCASGGGFDGDRYLADELARRVPAGTGAVEIPFRVDPEVLGVLASRVRMGSRDDLRVDQIQQFIFRDLGLAYAASPTRNAMETYQARQGNCLSFVNLFVALARHSRLPAFFVEVVDHQRWHHKEGVVVSQGHIVAGLHVGGKLRTFDFLPYRPKSYRNFRPIDDVRAVAHFYNNRGAEALLAGDLEGSLPLLTIAYRLDPTFDKARSNLAVAWMRSGRIEDAVALLEEGLEADPDHGIFLVNLARGYQRLGQHLEARRILERLDRASHASPYFFLYRAELAQAEGDLRRALEALRDGLQRDSEVPDLHVAFVKVYLDLGDFERARHHLGRALQLDATHAEAQRLARLLAVAREAPAGARRGGST